MVVTGCRRVCCGKREKTSRYAINLLYQSAMRLQHKEIVGLVCACVCALGEVLSCKSAGKSV